MFELCYTSLPRGLVPGTSGYTTVGQSPAMSRWLVEQAESLSSFHFLNEKDPNAYFREPVNIVHVRVNGNRQTVHIVSRIAACQPDHTGRSNYFAHHTLLAPQEALPCKAGPAELAAAVGFLMTEWTGEARVLPVRAPPAIFDRGPTVHAIEAAGLDLGWGPALADRLRDRGVKQTYLVYSLGTDMLGIVGDVLSNLTPDERWQATFATHATKTFPGLGVDCRLQCVVANTPYAQEVLSRFPADTFDLTKRSAPPPRRALATDSGSSVGRRSAGGKPPVAPGPSGRLTQKGAVPTSAQAYDDLGLSPYQKITIAQPPSQSDRQGQFGWPAILIPSVLSLAMAIGCGVLGYQWLLAREQVSRLEEKNGRLEDTNKQSQEELAQYEREVEGLKKDLRNAEKEGRAASAEKKPEPQPIPGPTETAQKNPPVVEPPMKDGPTGAATPAAQSEGAKQTGPTSADIASLPPKSGGSAPGTVREAAGPRVPKNISQALDKTLESIESELDKKSKKKQEFITLVENLADCPASGDITSFAKCHLIDSDIKNTTAETWDLRAEKKKIGDIKYNPKEKTIVLELMVSPGSYLARFLTLKIKQIDQRKDLEIVLGAPLNSELFVDVFSSADKVAHEKTSNVQGGVLYKLFKEKAAHDLIARILADYGNKNLSESFEFAKEEGVSDFTRSNPEVLKGRECSFAFVVPSQDAQVGVQFKRRESSGSEYKLSGYFWSGVVIKPLRFAEFKEKWKGVSILDLSRVEQITIDGNAEVARLKGLKDPKPAEVVRLEAAISKDKVAFDEARAFPLTHLQGKKVRLTLKMPEADDGFVIVDSLGSPDGN